ncbi:cache domain-containing sensor histidine kinase [Cohnella terricola]|uniref:histidine kinase n=1 Tax=Cohnella terricola TaxID=1289167 RepID=A0A559JA18_9BACL|nr:sensor histidine kinase [Cohnella terricola]TVX96711.1 sensor histidine kinase [Cohnella terricola]
MQTKWRFSYRNKLFVTFMLVCMLPVLVVQMVSYYVSTDAMKRKIDVLVQANLLQTSKNLDTSLLAYDDLLFQIITNDDVLRLVKEVNVPGEDVELSKRKLINMLSSYSYAKYGIRSVAIFTENDTLICYDQQTGSPYDNLWSGVPNLTKLPLYISAVNQKTGNLMTPPERMGTINNEEQYGFHLARKLTDYNAASLDSIGVVVITVYESVLARAINLNDAGADSPVRIDNQNFLADKDGIIISSPDKSDIGRQIGEVRSGASISNTFVNTRSGLAIHNLIDQKELFGEMYAMQRLTVIVGTAALIVAVALIFYFSGKLTASIRKVVKAMRIASQGGLTVQVEDRTQDEISAIAFNFNKMMSTVNELMSEVKETGEKRKEAEIRALEAQINPHFLYNSLDSINWLAIEKDEHQISEMLKGLAQILRYSIKDSNKPVSVREELEWMDRYMFLQQYRFRSSFAYTVEKDERALDVSMPKLVLQPFIENAIIHGFSGVKQGGHLHIGINQLTEADFEITIRDNGHGMDREKLRSIMSETDYGGGIGIRNVLDRLRMYYGDRASCEIESQPGVGTSVRIVLPIIRKGDITP